MMVLLAMVIMIMVIIAVLFDSPGWGKIRHPGSSHHTLQQAKLPPVGMEQCKRKLAQSPGKYYIITILGLYSFIKN